MDERVQQEQLRRIGRFRVFWTGISTQMEKRRLRFNPLIKEPKNFRGKKRTIDYYGNQTELSNKGGNPSSIERQAAPLKSAIALPKKYLQIFALSCERK